VIQSQSGRRVVLAFTVENIGSIIADNVYWMIDTGSTDENLKRTQPVNLNPGESTRAFLRWDYLKENRKTYNAKVIVDQDNLIPESNEGNNEVIKSITIT